MESSLVMDARRQVSVTKEDGDAKNVAMTSVSSAVYLLPIGDARRDIH